MNKDIYRETVRSKYFTTTVMDESLTDFKEPKKLAGPKAIKKEKAKKPSKKIRGQRDIRTALKSKKNELQKYAEDFDKVCKHAGLDVDSEQLQLAITLSKSLQESASKLDNPESSQSQSTQDRIGKIRTTLLEYGFKDIKNHNREIKKSTNRRLKKKKNYKLLLTSGEVKKQIISEKYSQVLFKDIRVSIEVDSNLEPTHANLYNLATSATYSLFRNECIFYVEKLLEQSTSTGNLLRDWSEIPGRPVSPELCGFNIMNFSEIECSQNELDIVLSGSLKSCRNVIKSKEVNDSKMIEEKREEYYPRDNLDDSVIVIDDGNPRNSSTLSLHAKEMNIDLDPKEDKLKNYDKKVSLEEPIVTVEPHRSCSPDLFDDELSVVDEINSKILSPKNKIQSQENPLISIPANNAFMDLTQGNMYSTSQKKFTRRCNDFMELTECVEIQCVDTYLSNKNVAAQSVTQRKSNDFMELTHCVSAPVTLKAFDTDIDLTQSPEETNSKGIVSATIEEMPKENPFEPMPGIAPITTETHFQCELLVSETNNVDLTESPKAFEYNDGVCAISVVSLDLTQSSNTSDDLPFVSLQGTKNTSQHLEETIVMDPKDYENHESIIDHDDKEREPDSNDKCNKENDAIPQVQHDENAQHFINNVVETPRQNSSNIETKASFVEEYYHDHSDNRDASKEMPIYNSQSSNIPLNSKQNVSDDIDLTQNSESSEEVNPDLQNEANRNNMRDSECYGNVSTEINADKSSQSDIDLTQDSKSEELSQNYDNVCGINIETETDNDATIEWDIDNDQESEENNIIVKSSQRLSSLGKRDNVSIDYDEVYDDQAYSSSLQNRSHPKSMTDNISKRDNISIDYEEVNDDQACSNSQQNISFSKSATDNLSNVSAKSLDTSNCSQHSEVFVISDNELDYSLHKSKLEKPVDKFVLGGLSIMDEFSALSSFRRFTNTENNSATANINEAPNNVVEVEKYNAIENTRTPIKHKRVEELATPPKPSCSGINTFVTPSNNEYAIKTNNVTPMPKYESMSLEDIHIELDKFGVKPFKRKRAIQLLTHIYNQTHPLVESGEETPCKRRKIDSCVSPTTKSPRKLTPRKIVSPKKTAKSPRKTSGNKNTPKKVPCKTGIDKSSAIESNERLNNLGVVSFSNHFEVNETPIIKEIYCNPEDWIFQKREKAKIHSCRVPLHIAFHNYVSSRRVLREAILCYEPVNIDDVHKDLVGYGHRYDPKDLLKFMDKKCITVKTTDNDARNSQR